MSPKRSAPSKASGSEPKRQRKMLTIAKILPYLTHNKPVYHMFLGAKSHCCMQAKSSVILQEKAYNFHKPRGWLPMDSYTVKEKETMHTTIRQE
ncbi:Hypothetical predicted protein [Octopus vulgaris]|uniref:Uncharacterized protein n=1 Tax=Octopus vulgaris TaxID=6645 RepID=A0AA36ALR3_OCTVU|nr:Hypothetical predicted protein [Octopus vulgaris]